ncbi:type II toxin-antitoxin system VapC family toxin [bacterium]|nr:type II toxin-antitoxin system VapC family toxin [bacterium]
MVKTVYLDTTVPSYYYEELKELTLHKKLTQRWWDTQRKNYEIYISDFTLQELKQGDYPNKDKVLNLVSPILILPMSNEIPQIVQAYLRHKLMPKKEVGDAFHLAFASYYKIDYLLTWNCAHLANANKFRHIQVVNTLLGLYVPYIITPEQLFKEKE